MCVPVPLAPFLTALGTRLQQASIARDLMYNYTLEGAALVNRDKSNRQATDTGLGVHHCSGSLDSDNLERCR